MFSPPGNRRGDGDRIVAEEWGNQLLVYFYDDAGLPMGMMYRNSSYADKQFDYYLYEKDVFGNIIAIYNASGTKVASYCYDAWGNCTVLTNVNGVGTMNPFRYRGYYLDTETNLYYLQSRYYDAYTGRFINADGTINGNGDLIGYNLFAYCSNNPVMYTDITGSGFWSDVWVFIKEEAVDAWNYVSQLWIDVTDSVGIELGIGCGVGGSIELDGASITGLVKSDFIHVSKQAGGDFQIGTDVEYQLGVEFMHCCFRSGSYEYTTYNGDIIRSKTYEPEFDTTISGKVQGYFIFGVTAEFSFDIVYFLRKRGVNV